jgi:AcrR family transcriptional regulator
MTNQSVSIDAELGRRSQILECTCSVIARDGAEGLRMAAVAREAGVSSALLHYYFATREDLIRLAFEYHETRESARGEERIAGIDDPLERVRDVLARELSDDEVVREGWVLWSEMSRTAIFRDDFRASVADRSSRWVGLVANLIGEAQEAGRIPAAVDPVSSALRLTSMVDGIGGHVIVGSISRAEARRTLDIAMTEMLHLAPEDRA